MIIGFFTNWVSFGSLGPDIESYFEYDEESNGSPITEKKVVIEGSTCKKCKEYSKFSEPNQPDGSFVCYVCRNRV